MVDLNASDFWRGYSGYSGFSGVRGFSGTIGFSGYSGVKGFEFQSVFANTTYYANHSELVHCDTTISSFTIYLPENPQPGYRIGILDSNHNFDINPLNVNGNGNLILYQDSEFICDSKNIYIEFIFDDVTTGWSVDIGGAFEDIQTLGTSGFSGFSGFSGIRGYSGFSYHSVFVDTDYYSSHSELVHADTSLGSFTVYLPDNPTAGDRVSILDSGNCFDQFPLTVDRNGQNILNVNENFICDSKNVRIEFIYDDLTSGWTVDIGGAYEEVQTLGISGFSGFSGVRGFSGLVGFSGYSGFCGYSGWSGFSGSGISGYSGSGISGYSGFCGYSGISGFSGSGISGYSGSGISGYSGSGISGYSGFCGYSGISGFSGSGISGYSGSGISGYSGSGISGFSGEKGISGYSGFCGYSGISGFSGSGISGYSGSGISGYSGSGISGYSGSGISGYSGSGISGYSGFCGYSGISGFSGSGISGYSGSGISGYSGSGISGYSGLGISGYSGYSGMRGFEYYSVYVNHLSTPMPYPVEHSQLVHCDTSGGSFSVILPSNPSNGDIIAFIDSDIVFDQFPLTILRNGKYINMKSEDILCDIKGTFLELIYDSDSSTWIMNIGGAPEEIDVIGTSGYSGYSGISGFSGLNGLIGHDGFCGYSGISGWSGISGYSGSGISGYSGSGISGYSGYSGMPGEAAFSGYSGYSGYCGIQGQIGYSGISGFSGSGISGYSGSGISGYSGEIGISGYSGFCGYSGISGFSGSGISGYSGSGISGYSGSGISGYSGSGISGYSGSGISGYSGFCGYSGISGFSGSGISGYSGSGISGYSGHCGARGISGFSGFIGEKGYSGVAGYSGISGYSGYCGRSGISGYSGRPGTNGYCGYSGWSGFSGLGYSGYSGYSGWGYISVYKNVDYTARNNDLVHCDTTSGPIYITAPANPLPGWRFAILDSQINFDNSTVTVLRNGSNIHGGADDFIADLNGLFVQFIYDSASTGWAVDIGGTPENLMPVPGSGGASTFLELIDTPSSYAGQSGKVVAVNGNENGVQFIGIPTGSTPASFVTLTDVKPGTVLSGNEGKLIRVNPYAQLELFTLPDSTTGKDNFYELDDVNIGGSLTGYSGKAGFIVNVNSTENKLELIDNTFLNLKDSPSTYTGYSGKYLSTNGINGLSFNDVSFLQLSDTPSEYNEDNKFIKANITNNGLEFTNISILDLDRMPGSYPTTDSYLYYNVNINEETGTDNSYFSFKTVPPGTGSSYFSRGVEETETPSFIYPINSLDKLIIGTTTIGGDISNDSNTKLSLYKSVGGDGDINLSVIAYGTSYPRLSKLGIHTESTNKYAYINNITNSPDRLDFNIQFNNSNIIEINNGSYLTSPTMHIKKTAGFNNTELYNYNNYGNLLLSNTNGADNYSSIDFLCTIESDKMVSSRISSKYNDEGDSLVTFSSMVGYNLFDTFGVTAAGIGAEGQGGGCMAIENYINFMETISNVNTYGVVSPGIRMLADNESFNLNGHLQVKGKKFGSQWNDVPWVAKRNQDGRWYIIIREMNSDGTGTDTFHGVPLQEISFGYDTFSKW